MLARWTLNNFKSFQSSDSLGLAPLTVFCGANSSGKSSVIQSMLLIKQTLEHSPAERVIALNGPLVQLGTFSDILNDHAGRSIEEIKIGWKIQYSQDDNHTNFYMGEFQVQHSCFEFSFDASGSKSERATLELQPDLRRAHISALVTDSEENAHELKIDIERVTGRGRRFQYDSSNLGDDAKLRFRVLSIDAESSEAAGLANIPSKIVGANVHHFAPSALITRYDRNHRIAKQAAKMLTDVGSLRRYKLPHINVSSRVLGIMADALAAVPKVEEAVARLLGPQALETSVDALSHRARYFPIGIRRTIRDALAPVEGKLEEVIHEELGIDKTVSVAKVEPLSRVTNLNDHYFRFMLHYLGPLRADPRPLYPLQAMGSQSDVGPKGEQTAAILHLNAKRQIATIPSSAFKESPIGHEAQQSSLTEAVEDWLKYLGVADAFETIEKGKLGHELRVRTPGVSDFKDLTNVGVGVSQVLPIVVSCLLAAPGSTLILEQPELHLHPAVQARLADFFIAMTLLNKQCIIETHSEHLIERMRFRVVQDWSNTIHESTKIYFFSKQDEGTVAKEIAVNRFGAIDDWPKDFFGQSQIANEDIVRMALRRHRAEQAEVKN